MLKKGILLGLCCLVMDGVAWAKYQKINLKSGGAVVGDVQKVPEGYKVTLKSGGALTVLADQVASVEDIITPEEEYEQQKAKIKADPKDPSGAHYELGQWAFRKEYYDIAKKELQEALRLRPGYEQAALLLKRVERMEKGPGGDDKHGNGKVDVKNAGGEKYVSDVDINRIKLAELLADKNDPYTIKDPVSFVFKDGIIEKFIKDNAGKWMFAEKDGEKQFRAYSNAQKAGYMLYYVEPDDYAVKDKIVVRGDPKVIQQYRRDIWPLVSRFCAGAECHGGQKNPGGLRLFSVTSAQREKTEYTNFFILSTFQKNGFQIIDRSTPDKSLLLQHGLPRKLAERQHPSEITPIFTDSTQKQYQDIVKWIDSLKRPLRDYGVTYQLPTEGDNKPPAPPPGAAGPEAPPADVPKVN